jgi:hypothetical protein
MPPSSRRKRAPESAAARASLSSLPGFERAIRPAAGLLLDDHRIDCAFELHDACGYRARRAFESDAADADEAAAACPMAPARARTASRFTRNVMINFI